jgi:RNA exonuclease 1
LRRYLKALKFDHLPVIDTAMLFKYKGLPRSTPGLADLCKKLLDSDMRKEAGGRDCHSTQETAVVMRLIRD